MIVLRHTLQLEWREPFGSAGISKQGLPDAFEERSLHRRIEPGHERWQVGVEKAQRLIFLGPVPVCQIADGSPVMGEQLRSHVGWCVDKGFRGPVQGSTPRPLPVDADQGQVMRPGRSVT